MTTVKVTAPNGHVGAFRGLGSAVGVGWTGGGRGVRSISTGLRSGMGTAVGALASNSTDKASTFRAVRAASDATARSDTSRV
jgi:hypothetical protein